VTDGLKNKSTGQVLVKEIQKMGREALPVQMIDGGWTIQ
jgi:hypothetical protein